MKKGKSTDCKICDEECPFKPVPVHVGTGVTTFLATEPTTGDAVVVFVALCGHTCFTTPEGLPAATSLVHGGMVSIGLCWFASAGSGGEQARRELVRKIVDRKGDVL